MLTGLNSNTAQNLQLGAGAVLKTKYEVGTELSANNILSATNGGIHFTAVPQWFTPTVDGASDVVKGLKKPTHWVVNLSFTAVEADAEVIKTALGVANDTEGVITGKTTVADADYKDFYVIGEKGDGSIIQITLKNGLNTNGLDIQTANNGNGGIAFNIMGHYDFNDLETPPFEIETIVPAGA